MLTFYFEIGSYNVALAGLELVILLPQTLEQLDCQA